MVLFDQATYDKLLVEVPKYKLITPSVLSDRLRVSSSHKMLIYWIMLVPPNCLCSCIRDSRKTLYKMNLLWAECFSCSIDPFFYARLCCNLFWVVNTMSLKTSTFSNKTWRGGKRGVPYVFVWYFVWLPVRKLFWRIEKGLCCLRLKRIADLLSLNGITSQFFYMVQAIGYVLTRLQFYYIGLDFTGSFITFTVQELKFGQSKCRLLISNYGSAHFKYVFAFSHNCTSSLV
jgi:hypothetical protein